MVAILDLYCILCCIPPDTLLNLGAEVILAFPAVYCSVSILNGRAEVIYKELSMTKSCIEIPATISIIKLTAILNTISKIPSLVIILSLFPLYMSNNPGIIPRIEK
ncbi:hypothetical protein HS5_06830 [Acidianus sp. HS-5]|nr:hypothetical protein HS5_06830 [Acidianus sp. HS-5]